MFKPPSLCMHLKAGSMIPEHVSSFALQADTTSKEERTEKIERERERERERGSCTFRYERTHMLIRRTILVARASASLERLVIVPLVSGVVAWHGIAARQVQHGCSNVSCEACCRGIRRWKLSGEGSGMKDVPTDLSPTKQTNRSEGFA